MNNSTYETDSTYLRVPAFIATESNSARECTIDCWAALPVNGFQNRTDYMTVRTRRLMIYVMTKMSAVPDHDILVLDRFAVHPTIEASFIRRPNGDHAIVDLRSSVSQNPQVAFRKRPVGRYSCYSVICAWNDVVALAGSCVFHAPFTVTRRITGTPDLVVLVVPA